MNILQIGDITGSPGRKILKEKLPSLAKEEAVDFIIANGENAAGGSGVTPSVVDELFSFGIDVITTGDHIWKKKEAAELVNADNRVLRPANYPDGSPGFGFGVFKAKNGQEVGVVNLLGRVFMQPIGCPFLKATECIDKIKDKTNIIFVDMHAEATSEKVALGWHLNGKVSSVFGTHTHVQTADEKILSEGTAYITDIGMTGPFDSVIGRRKEEILERFITQMPVRFQMAEDDVQLHGAIVDVDQDTGKAQAIKRIQIKQ